MPRPKLAPGTYGEISVWSEPRSKSKPRYRASASFRGHDGRTRQITRIGQTKDAAKKALRTALAQQQEDYAQSGVTGATTIDTLAARWLAEPHDWSVNTRETYEYAIKNQIRPQFGGLALREVRPSTVLRAINTVTATSGPSAAKTMRSTLAGMLDYAVLEDAIQANPARGIRTATGRRAKKEIRALTVEETQQLHDALRADERAMELDIPDLVDWMLGTGCRIGEACAVRAKVLKPGTVEINATAVRVKGHGMVIQEKPKTAAGHRVIALPDYLTPMLEERAVTERLRHAVRFLTPQGTYRDDRTPGVVFVSPNGHLRDPSNTAGDLREALDAAGFEWVTSHVFRKTVVTRLDEAGLTARQIADHVGHSKPSMTQDHYMGRKVVCAAAADALSR